MSRVVDDAGFTLAELLVVLVVLGLLAALVVPGLLSARKQSSDVVAKANVRHLVRSVEECRTDMDSYADCNTVAELGEPGVPYGTAPGQVAVVAAGANSFTVRAVSKAETDGTQHLFWVRRTNTGDYRRNCSPGGEGGCSRTRDDEGNRW